MEFEQKYLSVSEISNSIKYTLETNFETVKVVGEISNFKPHAASGHWYFTLKDDKAQINCTMWNSLNSRVFFKPQDGMKVVLTGKVSVYIPRGTYSLDARLMVPMGEGELQAAFEKLKRKLEAEGLFDKSVKKEIPEFPQKIGIVTAVDSAAMKDMVSVATRRYPLVNIVVVPTKVQGAGAAEEIVRGIEQLNKRTDIETIIVARGGGSIEDLWAFNEEIVARAIYKSKIPIISGVGHEIDYTIADFVADLRAITPTAAMELATPDLSNVEAFLSDFIYDTEEKLLTIIEDYKNEVSSLIDSYGFRIIKDNIKSHFQYIDNLIYKLNNRIESNIKNYKTELLLHTKTLAANDINSVLKKGYAIVKQNSRVIERKEGLEEKNSFTIKFYDGEISIN